MNAALDRFTVGEPFIPGRTGAEATASVSFSAQGAVVALVLAATTDSSLSDAANRGIASFAWIGHEDAALLCVRLHDSSGRTIVPWQDIPYHIGTDVRGAMPAEPGELMPAVLVLIDASGHIAAKRERLWPSHASNAIQATLEAQRVKGFSTPDKFARLAMLRAHLGDFQELIRAGATVWTDEEA